jgi:hypothetical protein
MNQEEDQNFKEGFPSVKSKNLGKILALSIILPLFIFLVALATRFFDPLWNPFRPKPQNVLARMEEAMEKLKTYHEKIDVLVKVQNEEKIEGEYLQETLRDLRQPENPKSETKFNLNFSFLKKEEPTGFRFNIAGETKELEQVTYFKITNFPFLKEISEFAFLPQISSIENTWIKFDSRSAIQLLKTISEFSSPKEKEDLEKMIKLEEEIFEKEREKRKAFEKELKEKSKGFLAAEKILSLKTQFPDEKIGKEKVYHYLFLLNKEEFNKRFPEFLNTAFEVYSKYFGFAPLLEKEKAKEALGQFLNNFGEIEIEFWVGKKDYRLYKWKAKTEFDLSFLSEKRKKAGIEIENPEKIKWELFGEFSNFDQDVKIEPPSEYKDISEILSGFFELLKEESLKETPSALEELKETFSPSEKRDEIRKNLIIQIQKEMEKYYQTHLKYPSSSVLPKKIGDFIVPKDPGNGPCAKFRWISNLGDSQKFCFWTCLEKGTFFAASPKGTKELNKQPSSLDCW